MAIYDSIVEVFFEIVADFYCFIHFFLIFAHNLRSYHNSWMQIAQFSTNILYEEWSISLET